MAPTLMMALNPALVIALLPGALAQCDTFWSPQEWAHAKSVEELHHLMSTSTNQELLVEIPEPIRGANLTMENLKTFFTPAYAVVQKTRMQKAAPHQPNERRLDAADVIVEAAKGAWAIWEDSEPTINVNTDYSSAVPKSSQFQDMQGWQLHYTDKYSWGINNNAGYCLCQAIHRIRWNCDGCWSENGGPCIGKYTQTATQDIPSGDEGWWAGYFQDLSGSSQTSEPINHGSIKDPIAQVHFTVDATCSNSFAGPWRQTWTTEINGDCTWNDIDSDGSLKPQNVPEIVV